MADLNKPPLLPQEPRLATVQVESFLQSGSLSTYVVHNLTSERLKYVRIEEHDGNMISMPSDRILFSIVPPVSSPEDIIQQIASLIPNFSTSEWLLRVEKVDCLPSLAILHLDPPNSIALFDSAMAAMQTLGLKPFPDWLMDCIASSGRKNASYCNLSDFSVWKSPYGGMSGPKAPPLDPLPGDSLPDQLVVGLIDDFDTMEDCSHGKQCKLIIESLLQFCGSPSVSFLDLNTFEGKADEQATDVDLKDEKALLTAEQHQCITEYFRAIGTRKVKKCSILHFICILIEALDRGVNLINLSMAWRNDLPAVWVENMMFQLRICFSQLKRKNCLLILSAGNEAEMLDLEPEVASPGYVRLSVFPALAREEQLRDCMVVVGATDVFGLYWSGSSFGPRTISITAPGENVQLQELPNGFMTGTSASAALVTAALAMLLMEYPRLRRRLQLLQEVRPTILVERLLKTADVIVNAESSGKCRPDCRVNIIRATRKELIGDFGVFSREEVSEEARETVLKVQEMIQRAENIERYSTLVCRDKAFLGLGLGLGLGQGHGPTVSIKQCWKSACQHLRSEVEIYSKIPDLLEEIEFEDDETVAMEWRDEEVHRVRSLLATKKAILREWKAIKVFRSASLRSQARAKDVEVEAMVVDLENQGLEHISKKVAKVLDLYHRARSETIQAVEELEGQGQRQGRGQVESDADADAVLMGDSSVYALWKHEEFWIRHRIEYWNFVSAQLRRS